MTGRVAVLVVLCMARIAQADSGGASNTRPDDSDIRLELTAHLPIVRATIHAAMLRTPMTLHVKDIGNVDAATMWPIGEGDTPLAIAFVVDERIRGDVGAAYDQFVPVRVPPGSQLTIVTYGGSSATVLSPLQPVEDVHGAAFGANVLTGDGRRDLALAIRTAVHVVRPVAGAIPRVIVIDQGPHTEVPNWHEHPDDAEIQVDVPDYQNDPVSTLTHELHLLDPTIADFDVRQLAVFDGKPHTYWVTMGEFSTKPVTLELTRDGRLVPPTRHTQTAAGSPSTPSWLVALFAFAQLAMLVIAYRVALRESPPVKSR